MVSRGELWKVRGEEMRGDEIYDQREDRTRGEVKRKHPCSNFCLYDYDKMVLKKRRKKSTM